MKNVSCHEEHERIHHDFLSVSASCPRLGVNCCRWKPRYCRKICFRLLLGACIDFQCSSNHLCFDKGAIKRRMMDHGIEFMEMTWVVVISITCKFGSEWNSLIACFMSRFIFIIVYNLNRIEQLENISLSKLIQGF